MAEVKWIKIVTDIFDDEKMLLIDGLPEHDAIIVIWFKLLCLAGKQNNGGVLMINDKLAYNDEMLAIIFRRPINTVRLALKTFEMYGMIEIFDGAISIPNWSKHQNLESIEQSRDATRKRVQKYRERQRQLIKKTNDDNCNDDCNVTVTLRNGDRIRIDKDIDRDKEKEYKKEKNDKRFSPPSIDDVRAYCKERKNNVDAEQFVDFYASKGWKVGNQSMKDWKAAVRTWERRKGGMPTVGPNGVKISDDYDHSLDDIL